jgi:hypothetical protein
MACRCLCDVEASKTQIPSNKKQQGTNGNEGLGWRDFALSTYKAKVRCYGKLHEGAILCRNN